MSIERRENAAGARWRVRLHSGGRVVADRTFTTKRAAEAWERQQKEALHGGGFVSPQKARTPVSEVAAAFLVARSGQVAPHTLRTDRDNLAALPPKFTGRPIGSVSEADVLALLTDILGTRAHSTARGYVRRSRHCGLGPCVNVGHQPILFAACGCHRVQCRLTIAHRLSPRH